MAAGRSSGSCHPPHGMLGHLTSPAAMADNSRYHEEARFALEAQEVEQLHETLDRLRVEVDDLRASRQRLVVAADDARRSIERELHDGVQQYLIALSVSLQLASRCVESEPAAAKALLDEMGRDVQQAIDETARLAQRIHPPFVAAGGLAAALRVAAASAGADSRDRGAGMRRTRPRSTPRSTCASSRRSSTPARSARDRDRARGGRGRRVRGRSAPLRRDGGRGRRGRGARRPS